MLVKICGITTQEAANTAVQAGADFIGFVFAPSKRRITPAKAATIAATLPSTVKKVGVFVNESLEEVKKIVEQVGLDYIQLHGDETPEYAKILDIPIIKAFSVNPENLAAIKTYPCDYYLLDSPKGANRGGNGTTFDWDLLAKVNLEPEKIILAGGLHPDNVQDAIAAARPAGVDVSSGVETDGQKDLAKIKQFITNVKRKDEHIDHIRNA
ncbi:phosphoribosylanthranilate isomerase [Virgibacillus dakarensis]|uniref:N-(5'-phosphoribosyl)anthranilate isomerase n=1 Tax=Lentibacillus populi TaxID=1827502 RepID=A0A9W5TZJ8_9BACI|nr:MULTISPECIES: phosphoribosylanthranilate isomerase [Bacillaceae]MBT2214837.1 phosphoribosylanthranilate isomerase [Virgibacillus dakarensis]MTW84564.1 phosphoribosylanthranilate isomerase [Virgibacillus dakarensis]GGB47594.1 N-(5'-phosphoribosyl)anthranilate isomerase [Lentibacillus populi]